MGRPRRAAERTLSSLFEATKSGGCGRCGGPGRTWSRSAVWKRPSRRSRRQRRPRRWGAMWLPGEAFVDSANGISVGVLSATSQGFVVTVTNGTPDITVSPLLLDFGNVAVGTKGTGKTVTVQNDGAAALVLGTTHPCRPRRGPVHGGRRLQPLRRPHARRGPVLHGARAVQAQDRGRQVREAQDCVERPGRGAREGRPRRDCERRRRRARDHRHAGVVVLRDRRRPGQEHPGRDGDERRHRQPDARHRRAERGDGRDLTRRRTRTSVPAPRSRPVSRARSP